MKKTLIFAAAAMLGIAALGAISSGGAGATKPDDEGEHKVWVCHVVEGQGELKNGYNLIEVDVAAVESEGHLNHVSNDGLRRDIIPAPYGELSQCIMPKLPAKAPVETEWVGPGPTCSAQSVLQTHIVTTYSYVFDPVAWEYVEKVSEVEVSRQLTMTEEEMAKCITKQESLPPVLETPVVAVTPVVETPVVAAAPAVEVAGTTVAAAPSALPATGGETWTIFLVGLATLLAGAGLVTLSRHAA